MLSPITPSINIASRALITMNNALNTLSAAITRARVSGLASR